MDGSFVEFRGVDKSYDGRTLAVRDLNLSIKRGEFLTLLGPSGSGKTTTLNMLAGFERPVRGIITLNGRPVDRLPPYMRNIGMVFQNYALFPHMSVAENVAFPLTVRRVRKTEQQSRVQRALDMVRLGEYGTRRPDQLSGGQQQRVALARALVFEPELVLMDEPLGALDRKLREHMQIELKQLHDMLGITILYVTHDQGEALTMSNRVAVFNHGSIAQLGTPDELYSAPSDIFVASFIGENNLLPGVLESRDASVCRVRLDKGPLIVARPCNLGELGRRSVVAVRPEHVSLSEDHPGENHVTATIEGQIYLGDHCQLVMHLDNGQKVSAKIATNLSPAIGTTVSINWAMEQCWAMPAGDLDLAVNNENRRNS